MRRRGVFGGLMALALAGCASEIEVDGVVRDVTTGEPVRGATVHVGEEARSVDERGRFAVEDIDAWSGQSLPVYVTAPGYEPVKYIRPVWDQEQVVLELRRQAEPDTGREARTVGEETRTIRTGPEGDVLTRPETDGLEEADAPIEIEPSDEADHPRRDPRDRRTPDPRDRPPIGTNRNSPR